MRRKLFLTFTALAALAIAFTGCKKDAPKPDPKVLVTGISLNKTTLTLTEGDEETLEATVTPGDAADKTVTWKSNGETIATVDANGKVTAVAPGEATITATAKDSSGKFDECVVTVEAKLPQITLITDFVGEATYHISGEGECIIDWGDGSESQTVTLLPMLGFGFGGEGRHRFSHTYAETSGVKTVTIKGNNVTGIFTSYSKAVSEVDLSKMPTLTYVDLASEKLTAIDISKNTSLNAIYCFYNNISSFKMGENPELAIMGCDTNNMSRETLVYIINALPVRLESEGATFWCGYNPGFEELTEADHKIANDKNWVVAIE